jgi:hypothetical protein
MNQIASFSLPRRLERAREWFQNSGIQSPTGGIYSWLKAESGQGGYLYSEITGYALNLYMQLKQSNPEGDWMERSLKAFHWLETEALTPLGVYSAGGEVQDSRFKDRVDQVFTFDNAIILHGLCQLYRVTKSERVLARARRISDWLSTDCLKANGELWPLYKISLKEFVHDGNVWSLSGGGYHAKVAMALAYFAHLTSSEEYATAARKICDRILQRQEADGRFATYDSLTGTNAHPLCYTAEGLWFCGRILESPAFTDSSRRASRWLLSQINEEGLLPRLWLTDKTDKTEKIFAPRADVLAQALRLATLYPDVVPETKVASLEEALLQWQVLDGEAYQNGGFRYGFTTALKPINDINWWVTGFAYQALSLRVGGNSLEPFDMV